MKKPTFFQGVVVALVASLIGSILFAALTPMFSSGEVLRLLIAGMSLSYIIYLLGHSHVQTGRISLVALWALLAGVIFFLTPSLPLYLLLHVGAIWLIRSLYFYSSLLCALADLVLNGIGLAAAIWAFVNTGNLFLGIWCFFLVQALFVAIPAQVSMKSGLTDPVQTSDERFERAHRTAQAAVRKLSSFQ